MAHQRSQNVLSTKSWAHCNYCNKMAAELRNLDFFFGACGHIYCANCCRELGVGDLQIKCQTCKKVVQCLKVDSNVSRLQISNVIKEPFQIISPAIVSGFRTFQQANYPAFQNVLKICLQEMQAGMSERYSVALKASEFARIVAQKYLKKKSEQMAAITSKNSEAYQKMQREINSARVRIMELKKQYQEIKEQHALMRNNLVSVNRSLSVLKLQQGPPRRQSTLPRSRPPIELSLGSYSRAQLSPESSDVFDVKNLQQRFNYQMEQFDSRQSGLTRSSNKTPSRQSSSVLPITSYRRGPSRSCVVGGAARRNDIGGMSSSKKRDIYSSKPSSRYEMEVDEIPETPPSTGSSGLASLLNMNENGQLY